MEIAGQGILGAIHDPFPIIFHFPGNISPSMWVFLSRGMR